MTFPGAADDAAVVAAGQAIRDHAEEIVARWVERVATEPEVPTEHRHDLRDHLPILLERLGRDLAEGGEEASDATEAVAEKHGRQRWQLGWRLEEVIRDFQTLRPVIEEFLSELGSELSPAVMSTIAGMIDEAVVDSVRSFTEFQATLENDSHRTAAEFAAIVSSSTDAIISMTMDGKIQSWNRAAEAMYGYAADEVLGQHASLTLPPERHAELERFLAQVGRGNSVNYFDTVRVTKEGKQKVVSVSASPIHNRSGHPIGCATIERDITKRTKAAEALRHALEEAESANRIKTEFLANVSHELRTPMNAIIGMTALVLEEELSPAVRDSLQTAREAADQLRKLVDDLLDISRLESGKFELEDKPFSLRRTIEETMRLASVQAFQKGLEIVSHVEPNVPDHLHGDALRLRQILANLVSNAVKFTDQGEVVVDVSLKDATPDACDVAFRVSDTGIGISATDRQRIFKPFSQTRESMARQQEGQEQGTGLGLSIASHLVSSLGGQLQLESTLGEGSTFSFVAHFRRTDNPPHEDYLLSTDHLLRSLSVLVVDDNESNRLLVEELLKQWGMKCVSVDTSQAAMQQLSTAARQGRPFQLVLIDALMPDQDGFALAEEISQMPEGDLATVLMLSPQDRLALRERCANVKVDGFLDKPIGQSGLFNTILSTLSTTNVKQRRPSSLITQPPATEPLHVLVAEDTAANQKVVERVLAKRGHEVTVANNGREALELARQRDFDVILMDVSMPIMDGFQATAAIREWEQAQEREHALPIIAMTAHALRGDRDRCLAAGMTDYIAKPVDIATLTEQVERHGRRQGQSPQIAQDGNASHVRVAAPMADRPRVAVPTGDRSEPETADLDAALRRLRGDRVLLAELIDCYASDHVELLDSIEQALQQKDLETAHRASHSLKGLAANFDAHRTTELAAAVCRASTAGNLQEAVWLLGPLKQSADDLALLLTSAGEELRT